MSQADKQAKRAVILLSGGLDSTTVLAIAKQQGFECYTLSFQYGQRHHSELTAAKSCANYFQVKKHVEIEINLGQFGGSALTDHTLNIPDFSEDQDDQIPITYVPARNTIFLSYAMAWAEVLKSKDIFIGVNHVDYSGYPDCRPEFISAFSQMANLATKEGVEGNKLQIHTPLIQLTKAEIIQLGYQLGVDYQYTISCYQADDLGRACGCCDSCGLRKKGFQDAGIDDPTHYQDK